MLGIPEKARDVLERANTVREDNAHGQGPGENYIAVDVKLHRVHQRIRTREEIVTSLGLGEKLEKAVREEMGINKDHAEEAAWNAFIEPIRERAIETLSESELVGKYKRYAKHYVDPGFFGRMGGWIALMPLEYYDSHRDALEETLDTWRDWRAQRLEDHDFEEIGEILDEVNDTLVDLEIHTKDMTEVMDAVEYALDVYDDQIEHLPDAWHDEVLFRIGEALAQIDLAEIANT